MFDHADLLLLLSRALAESPRDERWPALCRAAVAGLGVDGGSIVLRAPGGLELVAATSERAAAYFQVQEVTGRGPVHDVLASSAPVLLTGSREDRRRPSLGYARDDWEVGPVAAMPMLALPTEVVGVFTIHHLLSSGLGRDLHGDSEAQRTEALDDLRFVADTLGAVVLADSAAPDDDRVRGSDRDRVSQAVDVVAARSGGSTADALALLKARAFVEGTTVAEISRRLLAGGLDL